MNEMYKCILNKIILGKYGNSFQESSDSLRKSSDSFRRSSDSL